jgi:two-component system response regulator PhoP
MRILVVEDEAGIREQIVERLRSDGFAVDASEDGRDGLYIATEYPIDLAIVDLGLPLLDGIELITTLRGQGVVFPILVLTARTRWQDKVHGLEAGADDYLAKPFHVEELMARVRALIRRTAGLSQAAMTCGPVTLNTSTQSVTVSGQAVDLTAYEYRVLQYLMLNTGKVISKTELTEHIYEEDQDRDSNVIEVFVGRLRRKIDLADEFKPIETLRGRGYRFNLPRSE